jgi:hypothetical protein
MSTLTCFISKFLETDNIDNLAKSNPILKPFYLGCYPANVKPKDIKDRCCWVWNVDEDDKSGTHWICVVKNDNNIIFLDSFGKSPRFFKREYWIKYFHSLKGTYTLHTQLQRQSYISRTCGVWCLVFLHTYYNNEQGVFETFSVDINKLLDNERKLQTIAYAQCVFLCTVCILIQVKFVKHI